MAELKAIRRLGKNDPNPVFCRGSQTNDYHLRRKTIVVSELTVLDRIADKTLLPFSILLREETLDILAGVQRHSRPT